MLKPWEQSRAEYLGEEAIIQDDAALSLAAYRDLTGARQLEIYSAARQNMTEIKVPGRDDLCIFSPGPGLGILVDRASGEALAGMFQRFPWTPEAHRGKGYASLLMVAFDLLGERRNAVVYTMPGLKARLRAHALHVNLALGRGDTLGEITLSEYQLAADGTAAPVRDYSVLAHRRHQQRLTNRRRMQNYLELTRDQLASFELMMDEHSDEICAFSPSELGAIPAFWLSRDMGASIRHVTEAGVFSAVQAVMDLRFKHQLGPRRLEHQVIDIWGIRPIRHSNEELRRRGLLDDLQSVEVFSFPDVGSYMEWLAENDPLLHARMLLDDCDQVSRRRFTTLPFASRLNETIKTLGITLLPPSDLSQRIFTPLDESELNRT